MTTRIERQAQRRTQERQAEKVTDRAGRARSAEAKRDWAHGYAEHQRRATEATETDNR